MQILRSSTTWALRHRALSAGAASLAVAAALLLAGPELRTERTAIPVPRLVYEIESVSNGHTASLLNLPLGQPGVVQAPIPVDIDGDLLPDVTVAVNLIDAEGILQNPPDVTDVIAPNVEINRLITAPVLGQAAKPLKINVKLTIDDLEGGPGTVVRFGYDTGLGGSIPTNFKAVLGGLEGFFNPLTAVVDTTGGYVGIDPGLPDLGLGPVSSSYEGPLTLIGGVETEGLDADVALEYSPFPDAVQVGYGTDDEGGQHITYAHGTFDDVDVVTDLDVVSGDTTTGVRARVDRMPRRLALDLLTTEDGTGSVLYQADADGRAPDVGVDLAVDTPGSAPLRADVDIEALPRMMSAAWEAPQDGPISATFDASGQGIGAVEARIATFDGEPSELTPFVPSRRQYLNAQGAIGDDPFSELFISARLERIRHAELVQADDGGFAASVDVGDGAQPLEANIDLDLRDNDLPKIDATATIAPLPRHLGLVLDPAGDDQSDEPLRIVYDTRDRDEDGEPIDGTGQPVDIDLDADVVLPEAEAAAGCGDVDTVCATLEARNVPPYLEARVAEVGLETLVDIDSRPRPGGAQPDLRADVVLGAPDPDNQFLAAPIEASAELLGLPPAVRVRMVQNADDNLEAIELHACDRDYDAAGGAGECSADTAGDEIGAVTFAARNFTEDDRPDDLVPASPLTPLYVTAAARGLDETTDLVLFEATGRFTDIARVQYTNVDDVVGVSTDVGGGNDFSALVDVRNVDLPGDDGDDDAGRVDIVGDVLLNPLPRTIDLCVGNAGRALGGEPQSATTEPCESADPFADGSADVSPLALALRASSGLDVVADLAMDSEGDPDDPADDASTAAQATLTNVPGELTALVQSPAEGAEGPLRVLATAPGAADFDVDLAAQFTTGGADCDDPAASGGDVSCIHAVIDDLPTHLSAYADTSVPGSANVQFYACDYDFAVGEVCRPGTDGEIGAVTATARIKTGSPDELPVRQPTMDQHLVMVADQEIDEDDESPDRDLQAQVAVREVRALSIVQTPLGFDGRTDLGDDVTPLEALAYLDLRNDEDTEGVLVDASATISPLPQQMSFSQRGPGADPATDPLVFTYDSSAAVDVVADGKVFPARAGDDCGDLLTACAHVEIDDIPEHVRAEVAKVNGDLDGDRRPSDLSIDLSLIPDDPSDPKVDVRADGVLGPDLETPLSPPLYFDASLVGAPRYTSVRVEGEETLVAGPDGLEVASSAVERLRIHACQLDDAGACVDDTEGEIDELTANVRSFDLRPTDFPPPPAFKEPLYASISQRPGGQMEAAARITDVEEVQYLNRDGLTGVRSVAGSNQDLAVHVDIEGLPAAPEGESLELGDLRVDEPLLDLAADVSVTPLPGELDVCLREGGRTPLPEPTGLGFTAPCENALPFGDDVEIEHSPMSVAYRANTGFATKLAVGATITGIDHETGEAADDHRFEATLAATGLPDALDVHVLSPIEREVATPTGVELESRGPLRALVDAPGVTGAGPTLTLSGAYLIGEDVVCKDARTSVSAMCVSGRLEDLPTRTEIFYDPSIDPTAPGAGDNLVVTTDGTGTTSFEDLRLSTVAPARDDDGALTGKADVLLVEGALRDIPKPLEIRGKLDLPEEPDDPPAVEFLVQDGKAIGEVEALVQNYIAPDPLAGLVVPDRPVGASPGPADQQIAFLQRGDAFKLDAEIRDVRGAGFRTTRATTGESMGTQVASLDFGADSDVRAFIDLQSDATSRVLADVLVEEMAAGVDLCFRGAYTEDQRALTPADDELYCDSSAVADGEGAFELASTPQGLGEMDVDAFIRLLSGGGTTILSARTDIENIPQIVRGRFPSEEGDTEIATFRRVAGDLVPDGIDQIRFEAASFDLDDADTGYSGTLPYQPRPQPGGIFPAKVPPASGNQYLHAALQGSSFHARGQVGKLVGPSSQLQRVLLSPEPCAAPTTPAPPDYPHFPDDDGATDYTCIRADFDSDDDDPLDLDVVVADGADLLRFRDAGITDVPSYLQATLATTEPWLTPELERGWRRPCGTAADEPDGAIDCMAPLLRVDQPTADSELFGVLETGREADLFTIGSIDPAMQLADLNALPATGWGDWGADPEGVRAKIVSWGSNTPENPDDDRTAVRAALRLDIPRSLTLDQIQSYDSDQLVNGTIPASNPPESGALGGKKAKDIRLRYAVRDGSGNPVDSIGELTGLVHDHDKNEQILISAPCQTSITAGNKTDRPTTCDGFGRGLSIPGELGLQLYTRQQVDQIVVDDSDTLRDSLYLHVDGRASAPIDAGIRMVPGTGPGTADGIGLLEVSVRGTPTGTPDGGANPLEPSFRLRAEVLTDKGIEPPGPVTFFPVVREAVAQVNSVFADFNFSPNDAAPARRVDAMIHLNGETKVGADIKGFSTVTGSTPATFSADAGVDIDPLSMRIESELSFNFSVRDILHEELNDLGFFGDIVAEIVGGLADAVLTGLEELVNHFPLVVDMEAGLLAQFQIDELSSFTMRLNLLHAKAIAEGPGSATIGHINLDTREFRSGVVFKGEIPIPFPLDLLTGGDIPIEIPLLTIDYLPGLIPGLPALEEALGLNTLIDFRNCSSLDIVNPFPLTNVNTLEVDGGSTESFLLYPLSDPRFQVFGVFAPLLGGPAGDLFLDAIAGPIFCAGFDPDDADLIGLGSGHPGNAAAAPDAFPDHPVPGQGGAPDILPNQVEPSNDPLPGPTPQPPPPGPPAPLPVPAAPGPRFTGPVTTIASPVSLCGTHTFSALTVDSTVTVASAPVAGNPFGTGTACPAGQEGRLTLRANNLIVNGTVVADGLVTANPFNVTPPAVATGTSGGGHGGIGGDGTTPAGGEPYGNATPEPSSFEGSPGAGPAAGAGGGVILLVGDESVIVNGTLSADGTAGGDNAAGGTCDANPDDFGGDGFDQYDHDGDPNTPDVDRPLADPPYEHGGPAGSGGGAGGGIVISATRVDLSGATVRARGGNGGPGLTGAGGGGGGGVVKVVAPIQTGVSPDVTAGLPGDPAQLCTDVPPAGEAGDGLVVQVRNPHSKVLPFGQFWYPAGPGAPSASFDGYVDAAAQGANTDGVSIVRCAVTLPVAAGPADPATLQPLFTLPTNQPTVSAPCGSGGSAPVQLGASRVFDDEFTPPDPDAEVSFTPPAVNQYLGVYSVALRPSTAGNDCLVPGDAGGIDDATDCIVERLPAAVDAVVGIDASRPTITIDDPAPGLATQSTTIPLHLTAADQAGLSGVRYLECRTSPDTEFTPCNPSTAAFQLKVEGNNVITVRAHDTAGNVSVVDTVTVLLDREAPSATATISAPDGTNGWHRSLPTITISGHSQPAGATVPYAYRFDNGSERECANVVCAVPASTIGQLLPGPHTFHFTAIDAAGNRLHDDDDPVTESPMQRPNPGAEADFKLDAQAPQVALALVPATEDQAIGPDAWYDTRPFVVAGAIDQVGASGLNQVTHDFGDGRGPRSVDDVRLDLGDGNGFRLVDPFAAPRLPDGVRTVCARAVDAAGNVADECRTVRVDSTAPSSVLLVDGSTTLTPTGDNGWFVTTPDVAFAGYDDGTGVGTLSDRFRFRVDNSPYRTCDPACSVPAAELGTGRHLVHLAGRDRFDNVDDEQTVALKVDLDAPAPIVLITPAPAGSNDWQLKRPYVRLAGVDQPAGSGVSHLSYAIDGGPMQTYGTPFRISRGEHALCVTATDVAGNTSRPQCRTVRVDLDDPTASVGQPGPDGLGGWYVTATSVTLAAADAAGDSGVDPTFDALDDLCSHLPHAHDPDAPSGTCVSVDGRPFRPYLGGPISIREGVHEVRTYAVDVAGRRGPITTEVVRVDLSDPVPTERLVPPAPARGPWYRTVPDVHLAAVDGDQNAGVTLVEGRLGAEPFTTYTGPFAVGEGSHTLSYRAEDAAGRTRTVVRPDAVQVDLTPPVVRATAPSPALLIQIKLLNNLFGLLGPQTAELGWEITENLSGEVEVDVIIHDLTGNVVRRLDGGTVTVTPGVTKVGSTTWDGKDHTILQLVPLGLYYYRVVATDEAGNVAHSGESKPIQLRAAVCLPLIGCL